MPKIIVYADLTANNKRRFQVVPSLVTATAMMKLASSSLVFLQLFDVKTAELFDSESFQCYESIIRTPSGGKPVCVAHPDILLYKYRVGAISQRGERDKAFRDRNMVRLQEIKPSGGYRVDLEVATSGQYLVNAGDVWSGRAPLTVEEQQRFKVTPEV